MRNWFGSGLGHPEWWYITRTLPLTVPPVRPPVLPRDVVYGLARVDRSGRLADRTVTGALGWRAGTG
jgi:hypothetical protein